MEKQKYLVATLCIVLSIYIKLFGIVGLALFLFYPEKWKLALYTLGWSLVLFVLPLFYIDLNHLIFQYSSWGHLLNNDPTTSAGYSVMGWLTSGYGFDNAGLGWAVNKRYILMVGVILFFIPLLRFKAYKIYTFRLLTLASILLWVVIFNHKAESPTFIIAMAGIALWFMVSKKDKWNITLFVSAFILTSLSATDLFPRFLFEDYFNTTLLKGFPCIVIWLKIIYDMTVMKADRLEPVNDR